MGSQERELATIKIHRAIEEMCFPMIFADMGKEKTMQMIHRKEKMMAEYITREAAIAYIREQSEECQKAFEELGGESGIYADAYNDLAEDFYSIPAADVAPVQHGRWTMSSDRPDTIICSCCDSAFDVWKADIKRHHYCPNCGARMDGAE